jgi:hypothetical protein
MIYPQEALKKRGFEITGFFYNPNIYPAKEYQARKQAVEDFSRVANIEIIYPEYNPDEYSQAIRGRKESPQRCFACWSLRLKNTACEAKEKGFDYFSTTLLVSPYQDHEMLKKIGEKVSQETSIKFYYEDFRVGYRSAHQEARAKGIYCQKYCGCIYSKRHK